MRSSRQHDIHEGQLETRVIISGDFLQISCAPILDRGGRNGARAEEQWLEASAQFDEAAS